MWGMPRKTGGVAGGGGRRLGRQPVGQGRKSVWWQEANGVKRETTQHSRYRW